MNSKKRLKGKKPKQPSPRRSRARKSKAVKTKPLKSAPKKMIEAVECAKFIHAQPDELTPEQAQFKKSFDERIKIYQDRLIAAGKSPTCT